jgi:hypothetical protein
MTNQPRALSALRMIFLAAQIASLFDSQVKAFSSAYRRAVFTQFGSHTLYTSVMYKNDAPAIISKSDYALDIEDAVESSKAQEITYDFIRSAIVTFKDLTGHTVVPLNFVVPSKSKDWPRELWRLELGNIANDIRNGAYPHQDEDLWNLGFEFFPSEGVLKTSDDVMQIAMKTYMKLNSNLRVKTNFVVPDEDNSWPMETWGFKLGAAINKLKRSKNFEEVKLNLLNSGINLQTPGKLTFDLVKETLLQYREINGDMFVPFRFIVPHKSEKWAQNTWGMELGDVVRKIRCGELLEDKREELCAIGFMFESQRGGYSYEFVKSALIMYKKAYKYMLIPKDFRIPDNSTIWPEEFWGMKLGATASDIKNKGYFTEKKQELISVGFEYDSDNSNNRRSKRETVKMAAFEINGNFEIPRKFQVPYNSEDWPEEMWGLKLGELSERSAGSGRKKVMTPSPSPSPYRTDNPSPSPSRADNDHLVALGF